VLGVVCLALYLYWIILLARVILSWVQAFGGRTPPALDPLIRVVYDLTEPIIGFFRRYIPPLGMFDLSVLVVFIVLGIFSRAIGC
jgi:YggT family protein